ncbi:hypothetical protein Efla_001389 [Eimeria flavescens]
MPFGAAGAPVTQQRMVDNLRAGMKWSCALAYLDDVIVFSNTFKEHVTHLRKLFSRATQGSLHFEPQKCRLCHPETRYLGFLVSAEGVRPDSAKTAALEAFRKPINIHRLRNFLGLANYYRRFIQEYARNAKPLIELTHANDKFGWTHSKQKAFDEIKRAVLEVARLAHPRAGKPSVIDCDACSSDNGGVRSIRGGVGTRYFSRDVEGSPTLLRTDRSPLPWIRSNVEKSAKVARWVLALQDFPFDLKHRAGKCHTVPDALSSNATPGADEDFMCYAGASERTGVLATATQPTPHLEMSREQHVSRAGGGEVTDSQGRHSQSEISLNDIRTAQATCPETIIIKASTRMYSRC